MDQLSYIVYITENYQLDFVRDMNVIRIIDIVFNYYFNMQGRLATKNRRRQTLRPWRAVRNRGYRFSL